MAPRDIMPTTAAWPPPIGPREAEFTADLKRFRDFLIHGAPGPHYYAVLLGLQIYDLARLMERVERGLSFNALERFQRNIAWPYDDLLNWLQISQRTLTRRRKQGRLTPEESDRLLRASRIFAKAVQLFEGDPNAAAHWLSAPQRALGGAIPVDFAKSEIGSREVESLIERLEEGVFT
jgi:putative toxin-antitoxin system antitoxin component (TIGR02293 family)